MKASAAIVLAAATAESAIISNIVASPLSSTEAQTALSRTTIARSSGPDTTMSTDDSPRDALRRPLQPVVSTSTSAAQPLLLTAPAVAKPGGFPSGMEWMHGQSMLVHLLVFSGRLAISDIPPPGQEHLIHSQFEDVVLASVMIGPNGEETKSFSDVYRNKKTEADYEAYLEAEKSLPKPYRGQIKCPFEKG
jgi:hypothetical protein